MVKPLYEANKGPDTELLFWNGGQESDFNANEQAFTRALFTVFTLKKPFILYIAEKRGTDNLKVLILKLGSSSPMGDCSKQLGSMACWMLAWLP